MFCTHPELAAKRAFSLKAVSRLLGKVRKVVTFFHESTIAHQTLAVKQEMLDIPKHKLIYDVTTHWITIHDMLERYVEQQPAIHSAVLDKAVKKSAKDIAMLTDNELQLAEELVQLLNPLKTMTTLLGSETSPTSSMILPLKTMALKSMAPGPEDSATIREVKAAFTQDLERRYKDADLLGYLHRATALDPRFKSLPFLHEACFDRVYKDLVNKIVERELQFEAVQCKRPSSSSPPQKKVTMSNLFGELFKVEEQAKPFSKIIEEEVTAYKMADCLHVDADPFAWWKTNQSKFPHIAKLAQQCLSVPGTCVASERVFSTAGDIVSASRSRLASENVDMLMFLQKNLNVEE
ncbi:hypothetical protein AGOR_G00236810 [Albula goreensis]|uniref:HAT C-terminal dimerisation domain-containing protein n=1 Tax=Albula goreensis TaxID=1534307 RepID=A0A8T3CIU1_9TELE|nr:hypothetical protein AGOR_G00236810 [Albula goreensis]